MLALACQVRWIDNIILPWDLFLMELMLFCRKICFAAIYAVLSRNLFCRCLRTFCVETNYGQNVVRGEKMTYIMYEHKMQIWRGTDQEKLPKAHIFKLVPLSYFIVENRDLFKWVLLFTEVLFQRIFFRPNFSQVLFQRIFLGQIKG